MNYAIILAAGKGTRMKTDLPKCLFPLLYKPMITYIVDTIKQTKFEKIIAVLGHLSEAFEGILPDDVEIAIQKEQLGTANAVLATKGLVNEGTTIILPGDTPLIDADMINGLLQEHQTSRNALTVGVVNLTNPKGYGRIVLENNQITRIVEELDATDEEKKISLVNTGIMVVDNNVLFQSLEKIKPNNAKNEYYLTDLVSVLNDKKVGPYIIADSNKLNGINDLYSLSNVEKALREKINRDHMLNGVNIVNPDSVTISADVKIAAGAKIYPGTVIHGNTVVEKNAVIGPNSEVYNSIIEENVVVRHSVVYDSTVKKHSIIGPFAHLRMHTIVGEKNRVGNFVEMKNATTGTKTNASHLSYIGDAELGNQVNFGCGAITVNYDGAKKHKTIVKDKAFIGCNTNLIAPVVVGENTITAAGSTVTKDVPDGDMAISRVRQENKEGFAIKYKKTKES